MPWHLSNEHPECEGFAVVLDEDDSLESCHETEEAAQAHLDELNAAEEAPPSPPPAPPGVSAGRFIQASFPTAPVTAESGEGGSRIISGTAVPWNEWGRVSDGGWVRFLEGSLDADARPVVAMGHDSTRPIGRVATNVSNPAGMATRVQVSRVRDGDEALVLAQDGVLGMFSVGVNPTELHVRGARGRAGDGRGGG